MKNVIFILICILLSGIVFCQDKKEKKQPAFGIKAGLNFAKVTNPATTPSFIPKVDVKNNLVQIYAGIRF